MFLYNPLNLVKIYDFEGKLEADYYLPLVPLVCFGSALCLYITKNSTGRDPEVNKAEWGRKLIQGE